jgi:hypothetical protein
MKKIFKKLWFVEIHVGVIESLSVLLCLSVGGSSIRMMSCFEMGMVDH